MTKRTPYPSRLCLVLMTAALGLFAPRMADAQAPIVMSFSSLPSQQGWTYFSRFATPETDVYSVDGSMLHQNTMNTLCFEQNGDPFAFCDRNYYTRNGVVDASLPFTLTITARVLEENAPPFVPFGFAFLVSTGTETAAFSLGPSVIRIVTPDFEHAQEIPHDNKDTFHTFRLEGSFGAGGGYRLFVDDVLISSGAMLSGDVCAGFGLCAGLQFADVDAGGNARADLSYYRFSQGTPPVVTSTLATPNMLWPPNHKMVPVSLAVTATGAPAPACQISSVSSSEGNLSPGEPAWIVTGPLTVNLRAERAGNGPGRTYAVTVQCTNAAGITSQAVLIPVPHDQR